MQREERLDQSLTVRTTDAGGAEWVGWLWASLAIEFLLALAWWHTGESRVYSPELARACSQRTIATVLKLMALVFIYIYADLPLLK